MAIWWGVTLALCGALAVVIVVMKRHNDKLVGTLATYQQNQTKLQGKADHLVHIRDATLNAIGEGVILMDESQVVIWANAIATAVVGKPMVGETLIANLRHNVLDELVQEGLRSPGEVAERLIEFSNQSFDMTFRTLTTSNEIMYLITLQDVTALRNVRRARHEMIANISHELRTPITTIGLLAETLDDNNVRRSKKGRKMVNNIRREVDTLTQLVQEMRDLASIESGQMPVKLVATSLRDVVKAGVEPLMALAENKAQTIAIDIAEDIIVLADPLHIERVVKNIVHNAIKFTPETGTVSISGSVNGDEATIAILDTGPGIPASDLPRVFERFFQVDRARKDGTGLGLAIARHIILAHGGRIWAKNHKDKGTSFFFTLNKVASD